MRRRFYRFNSVLVCTQADLNNLPPFNKDIAPLHLKEMDMEDESEIREWLKIHNDAFGRAWGFKEYQAFMLNHPYLIVTHTYFMMDESTPMGAGSVGVFKKNKEIGVGHYLGIRKNFQGRGLGKYMVLYRYHKLHEHGIRICESETTLRHKKSLLIHFDCGSRPKFRPDYWNTPDGASALLRVITIDFSGSNFGFELATGS